MSEPVGLGKSKPLTGRSRGSGRVASRSSCYYKPAGESDANLTLMRRIDEQYLATPFYGSRRMSKVAGCQPQASPAADAVDGNRGDLPAAADHTPGDGTPDLSVFADKCRRGPFQPGVEQQYHIHSAMERIFVSGGGDGLVQPLRNLVATVEHARLQVLPGGTRRRLADGLSKDFQYRPGRSSARRDRTPAA